MIVDFPDPLCPTSATFDPEFTTKLILSKTLFFLLYAKLTALKVIFGGLFFTIFKLGAEDVGSIDLIAVEEIKGMGIFGKAWSNIKLLVYRFLMEED